MQSDSRQQLTKPLFYKAQITHAGVAELADALDSGSSVLYGRGGSNPLTRTLKTGVSDQTVGSPFFHARKKQVRDCMIRAHFKKQPNDQMGSTLCKRKDTTA